MTVQDEIPAPEGAGIDYGSATFLADLELLAVQAKTTVARARECLGLREDDLLLHEKMQLHAFLKEATTFGKRLTEAQGQANYSSPDFWKATLQPICVAYDEYRIGYRSICTRLGLTDQNGTVLKCEAMTPEQRRLVHRRYLMQMLHEQAKDRVRGLYPG